MLFSLILFFFKHFFRLYPFIQCGYADFLFDGEVPDVMGGERYREQRAFERQQRHHQQQDKQQNVGKEGDWDDYSDYDSDTQLVEHNSYFSTSSSDSSLSGGDAFQRYNLIIFFF